jgi:hypothetical protein
MGMKVGLNAETCQVVKLTKWILADVVVPHYAEKQFNVHTIISQNRAPVIEGSDGSQPELQEMKLEKGEKN